MSDFLMPSLGSDMQAGTLVEWRVIPGDRVRRGDIVAVVETEKGAIEVEIFEDGVIAEIVTPIGKEVPVGTVLARIAAAGEVARPVTAPPAPALPKMEEAAPRKPAERPAPPVPHPLAPSERPARQKVTPAARQRARLLGIDLRTIRSGTGVEGAICLADVQSLQIEKPTRRPEARGGSFDAAAMRRAIAAAMGRSKREIPHYYLTRSVSLSHVLDWLADINQKRPVPQRLLPAALLLRAIALGLRETPELNGFYEAETFRPTASIHVGWAIALRGGGLIAPAIHDTDRKSLDELMTALRDLVQRARGGGLRSSELTDPTITVTSLGDRGADSVLPVIYPPQVAILGCGRIVERPWVEDGKVVPRSIVSLTLAADHRVSDGHRGGLLLAAIEQHLREPEKL